MMLANIRDTVAGALACLAITLATAGLGTALDRQHRAHERVWRTTVASVADIGSLATPRVMLASAN